MSDKTQPTSPEKNEVYARGVESSFAGTVRAALHSAKFWIIASIIIVSIGAGVVTYNYLKQQSNDVSSNTVEYTKSESDRIAADKQELDNFASTVEKTGLPTDADADTKFSYYNTLINNALSQQDCKKAQQLVKEYGTSQNLQRFSNPTLESLGGCLLLIGDKPTAKIVYTANLAKLEASKKSGQLDPSEITAVNNLIVQAKRLVKSAQ